MLEPDPSRRLLLVGWDAADWKVINPLLAAGEMPHLARLIANGVHGNHATNYPALSPMLWTTIATGKRPGKHGIHGFSEPTEDGLAVRPVSNLGRKTKAFWNILNQHGKRSIVVGWWPSHPAEPINGAMVSNHFPFQTTDSPAKPMAPATVWPPSEAEALAEMRYYPTEVTGDILHLFAPDFVRIDQNEDKSVHDLAGIIAETMSIHNAATDLMERLPWDLAAVYYAGIDHFSHRFMRYHARKAGPKSKSDAAWFAPIVANAYRYHDLMLGRLIQLAGPGCTVMVLSDHGFHSDGLLPDYIPAEAAGPAVEHRHFGIFCMAGPGVRRGERVYGAGVLNVAPTVLHLFGLPAGADMDGQVLINAFTDPHLPTPIPSWDEVPGEDGRHPPSRQYDGVSAAESLQQLVALGYVAPPGENQARTVGETVEEARYNLARSHMDEGRPDLAAEILRALIAADPEQARFHQHLFACHMQTNDHAGAARVLAAFDRDAAAYAPKAAAELKRRHAEKPFDQLSGERNSPDRREIHERRLLSEKAGGAAPERMFLRARLALAAATTPKRRKALAPMLEDLAQRARRDLSACSFLADGFVLAGQPERALEFTRRLLRADPENPAAFALEARAHRAAGRHEKAVARAVDSLALVYFQPWLHCLMAESLGALGERERAEQSFRIALAQAPGYAVAHDGLGRLLRRDRARAGEAALHMARAGVARAKRKPVKIPEPPDTSAPPPTPAMAASVAPPPKDRSVVVTIVSGLPRSGTSMMMQMLAAAGIEPYHDDRREADEDNPRGYFEHEKATRLHQNASWVGEARGKTVKVVAHLLPYLPAGHEYRIVFMHRQLQEVTASQTAMLKRLGRKGGALDERKLARVYAGQLVRVEEWLKRAAEVHVLPVQYDQVLADPAEAARRLAAFLGTPFRADEAAAAVAPALRRQHQPGPAASVAEVKP
jgi:predicted AlkP superfamily phosphohydrolase/phosphomutase/tetratricopeptide (TPR) repeat protein